MSSQSSPERQSEQPGAVRPQPDQPYRAIGISAVAAAAAQLARPVKAPESARHELPAWLRGDSVAA